jgi:hypothetical protein
MRPYVFDELKAISKVFVRFVVFFQSNTPRPT